MNANSRTVATYCPAERQATARDLRPTYFAQRDSLLASGGFTIEDRRAQYPPTGRIYAD